MITATFFVEGTAVDDQTWSCTGAVTGDFPEILDTALRSGFLKLTGGQAVYGKPGVGCRGPYKIARFELTVQPS